MQTYNHVASCYEDQEILREVRLATHPAISQLSPQGSPGLSNCFRQPPAAVVGGLKFAAEHQESELLEKQVIVRKRNTRILIPQHVSSGPEKIHTAA